MAAAKMHEVFSLTNELTHMTARWHAKVAIPITNDKMDCFAQIKGRFLSRVVNLLILPTDLIDAIAHLAMGILTLLILAPGEAIYNCCRDEKTRSNQFTMIGGLRNFAYAGKHLFEAIPRAIIGIIYPVAGGAFETAAQREAHL